MNDTLLCNVTIVSLILHESEKSLNNFKRNLINNFTDSSHENGEIRKQDFLERRNKG